MEKNRGDEPIQIIIYLYLSIYLDIWKCHKEAPCIAILDQQKCQFFKKKIENRRAEQVLSGGTSGRVRMWRKGLGG
jgi:hypothetical protein